MINFLKITYKGVDRYKYGHLDIVFWNFCNKGFLYNIVKKVWFEKVLFWYVQMSVF